MMKDDKTRPGLLYQKFPFISFAPTSSGKKYMVKYGGGSVMVWDRIYNY